MTLKLVIITFLFLTHFTLNKAQESTRFYLQTYDKIDSMLNSETLLSFKDAVLLSENAYLNGELYLEKVSTEN